MSEFFSEAAEEVVGIAETGVNAVEGVADAASGDWDGAADSSLSMSESALGVATGGVSEIVEQGWDVIADNTGLPTAHEALSEGTQAAGEALGDGMYDLVGQEHSYQAAMDFDDGNILSGLGEMAEGAGETILDGAESLGESILDGAEDVGDTIADTAADVGEDIADGAESVADTIADTAADVGEDIADGAEELWDDITG